MSKYAIGFKHPITGERQTVLLKETGAEAECRRIRRFWAVQQSLLQRGLEQLPLGFEHDVCAGFRPVTTN